MKFWGMVLGSIAVIASVMAVAGSVAWAKWIQIQQATAGGAPPEMPEHIEAKPVERVEFRQTASAVGTAVAPRWIILRNEVSGAVINMAITSGTTIRQGEVMVELDSSVERASLAAAEARCRFTRSNLERLEAAKKAKATSEIEAEQAQAEFDQANAEKLRIQAILEKKSMRAPFDARVGLINIHKGQYLVEGTEIGILQGIDDHIHIDFMLPQTVADYVEVGQTVVIDHRDRKLNGTIQAVDVRSDRATRNLMVRADLKEPPIDLTPNDAVRVEIEYGTAIQALAVPMEAIRLTPMGAHVFVVETDAEGARRAVERTIVPGRTLGTKQAVLGGLIENDRVVTEGSFKIRNQSLVVESSKEANPQ